MDCDDACERLPWLYAGTLDEGEADAVRRHLETCARCQGELDDTRRAAGLFGAHLPTAVLVDLAWDRPVTVLADELVRAHLAGCAECREELELARESRRLEPAAAAPVVVRPARWTWIAAALPATLAAGLAAGALWGRGTAPRPPVTGGDGERVSALEIEAARLRATVTDLEARVRAAASPRLNLPIFELLPGTLVERGGGGGGGNPVAVPPDASEIALLLTADGPAGDPVGLVLADASGREVWRGEGLRHGPPGGYVVTVPTSLLPDGAFVVTLRPARGPEATYRIRVRRTS